MPGLFGIISKNEALTDRCLLSLARRMADSMRRLPWLRAEIWGDERFCGGRVYLGGSHPQPQPLIVNDDLRRVWLDGEIYPGSPAGRAPVTAEKLSELVNGESGSLTEADGAFVVACYDAGRGELVLANDRLGFRPVYYTETEDWFAYASEVKALLAIRDKLPELDDISLRQFFGFDHMLGERTWWKGIELIPPASVWRISAQDRKTNTYWTFADIRRDRLDPVDVQIEFDRLWSEDVRRHSRPGTMPLLLSGGMDSRLLLAELCEQRADLVAVTFGSEQSIDMKLARLSAAAAGVPHRPCYLTTGNWWHHREEAIWQADGLINGFNFQVAIATDEMHTGNCFSPMNIAGDLLFGGSHLEANSSPEWSGLHDRLLARRYFQNPFFSCEEVLSASSADSQNYLEGPSSDCFHLRQRMRRLTLHGPGTVSPYCEIVFPGLSHGLVKLLLGGLSDEDRRGGRFYKRYLAMRHPKFFGDIPSQATGRGLAESFRTRVRRSLRARLRKGFGRWTRRTAPDEWFVSYPDCVRESKIREKLLQEDLMVDGFLDGAAGRALANGEGGSLSPQLLIGIFTLETYLRQVTSMPKVTDPVWEFTENCSGA
jgi:asparagine synthase (glutamine-hydrolysing)